MPACADEAHARAMSADSNTSPFHRLPEVMMTAGHRTIPTRDANVLRHGGAGLPVSRAMRPT